MELIDLTISQLQEGLRQKAFSARDVFRAYQNQIQRTEDQVRAFITLDFDRAQAQVADMERQGSVLDFPFYGVPIGVKEVLMTKGWRTTAGSKMLDAYKATYDATAVDALLKAGAVIMGKNNCDEFAMGASTENSSYFPTRNPYDTSKVPGGSSGGSAASVAARQVVFSIGTDTGGSIRQPAAFCGVVGLKPTYGLVSRYGLIAMASSFDVVGPITKTVEESALVLQAIAGHDPRDSTTSKKPLPDYVKACQKSIKNLRVGIPRQAALAELPENLQDEMKRVMRFCEESGVLVKEVDMPHFDESLATYYIIMPAEVSSNLAKFDGIRYGSYAADADDLLTYYSRTRGRFFGDEVKRRIMVGTFVLSSGYIDAYYRQAQKVRKLVKQDFDRVFEQVDAILLPTAPSTAFGIGEKVDDPLQMYLADIYTASANIAGLPALSVPTGIVKGMPYGAQFIGPAFSETTLFSLAYHWEQERGTLPPPSLLRS